MTGQRLDDELQDLSSAEDFLEYFGVAYDQKVVQVNRLHILQRFHDYLAQAGEVLPKADEPRARSTSGCWPAPTRTSSNRTR